MKIIQKGKNRFEIVETSFRGDNFTKLSQFPNNRQFKDGGFYFENNRLNLDYLIKEFEEFATDDYVKNEIKKYKDFIKREKKLKEDGDGDFLEDGYEFKTLPYDHQRKYFNISKDLKNYGLLFEQGTGKTKVIIDTASYLYETKKIDALVVIAPNRVHRDSWIRDGVEKHLPYRIKRQCFVYDGKRNSTDKEELEDGLKIFTYNIEALSSGKAGEEVERVLKKYRCIFVIDESHQIKNFQAKRTKEILRLGKLANYKRILTGTPITNGTEDMYTQLLFLDENILGIKSFYAFKSRYCVMGGYNNYSIVSYKRIEELQEKISLYCARILKKDCLDLPAKTYQKELFDMTEKQKKAYQDLVKDGILQFNDGLDFKVETALTLTMKLQQIASGFLIDTDQDRLLKLVPANKNPRLLKLKELLTKIEGKVIIWSRFKNDINDIMDIVGDKGVRYDGSIEKENSIDNIDKFRNDPSIKYFISNPQSGGTGLNLTIATTVIYYNNSFSLSHRLQSEDRCHRIGTTKNVNYIDLVANETLDNKILTALRDKKKLSDEVLRDGESFFMDFKG